MSRKVFIGIVIIYLENFTANTMCPFYKNKKEAHEKDSKFGFTQYIISFCLP
jgi:hypothetical protein